MWKSRRIPPAQPAWAALFAFSAGLLSAQATVEGTVVNSVTRAGIEGVSVKFYTQQGIRYETTTGGGGTFRIAGMRGGDYRSTLEKEGFEPPKSSDFPAPEPVTRVSGDQTLRVSLEMVPWTTLRGRVIDADGRPAARVLVRFFGPMAVAPDGGPVASGDDGSFAFTRLLPGRFILLAKPEPAKVPADGSRVEAVATYYPSEIEPSQAQAITVRGTGEESGYEIRLRRVPVHRVRGIVLDETGKASRGIKLQIAQPGSSLSGWRSTLGRVEFYLPLVSPFDPAEDGVLTGADGRFEFPSVREGEWTIRAASGWEYQEDARRDVQRVGEARVLVARDDIDDVEIRLASNFEVTASAEWPEGTSLNRGNNWSMIMLWPAEATVEPPTAETKPDGTLHFERVYPGRYYALPLASGVAGTYVAAVLLDGRDVLGQSIDLNGPPPPIRVVYKGKAGTVRATLQGGGAATLLVIPADSRSGGVPTSVRCDTGALCELANLRPGEYNVAAFDHVDGVKLSNPVYLPDIVARTTNVRVEEGATTAVELTVSHWPE